MFCGECGAKVSDNALFCGQCGSSIAKQNIAEATEALDTSAGICRNCGAEISENGQFCGECGTPLNESINTLEEQPIINNYAAPEINRETKKKENFTPLIIALVVVMIVCGGAIWYTLNKGSTVVNIELPDIKDIESNIDGENEKDNENITDDTASDSDTDSSELSRQSAEEPVEESSEGIEPAEARESAETIETSYGIATSEPDYLFPSDREIITREYLESLTKDQIALIRNEIYARHGYIFKTEPFKSYFPEKSWYVPNENFNENLLSDIEKENRDRIIDFEKEMEQH